MRGRWLHGSKRAARLIATDPVQFLGQLPRIAEWPVVASIPRGPAKRRQGWGGRRVADLSIYVGGDPRCPGCSRSGRVWFSSHGLGEFHCIRCRVRWFDSRLALCFVCGEEFARELSRYSYPSGKGPCSCDHLNQITRPFCARCEAAIGSDRAHCRRQLRRMVGLR